MTATNSMAFRAFSRRFQLDDTASRLDLLPLRPNANGTPRRASSEREISFGPFRLLPHQRLLTKAGTEARVGSRALDILIALLERPGKLVTRRELMERVWPQTVVVEANLNVNIAALRRALGDGHDGNRYLVTIPGRGYRFVASVTFSDFNLRDPTALRPSNDLPTPITRLVGRDEIVKQLAATCGSTYSSLSLDQVEWEELSSPRGCCRAHGQLPERNFLGRSDIDRNS